MTPIQEAREALDPGRGPATVMVAGVTDHVREIAKMVDRLDACRGDSADPGDPQEGQDASHEI